MIAPDLTPDFTSDFTSDVTIERLSRTASVAVAEIESWIHLAWLRPGGEPGRWLFAEVDVARVRLIAELQTLRIDEEAMPVVLSLLDQLYATRAELRRVLTAVEAAPPDLRATLLDRLASLPADPSPTPTA